MWKWRQKKKWAILILSILAYCYYHMSEVIYKLIHILQVRKTCWHFQPQAFISGSLLNLITQNSVWSIAGAQEMCWLCRYLVQIRDYEHSKLLQCKLHSSFCALSYTDLKWEKKKSFTQEKVKWCAALQSVGSDVELKNMPKQKQLSFLQINCPCFLWNLV